MKAFIPVTAAVLWENEHILVAKRASGGFAGKWEFPGGKVKRGESPEQCLIRELREELGIEVTIERPLMEWAFEYDAKRRFHFSSFLCRRMSGEPRLTVHSALQWVALDNLPQVDFLDADHKLVRFLLAHRSLFYAKRTSR